MRKLLILLGFLTLGCAREDWEVPNDPTPKLNQEFVTNYIWNYYFNFIPTDYTPPTVGWVDYTNCNNSPTLPGFLDSDGVCVQGDTITPNYYILLFDNIKLLNGRFSESAMAHELCHAFKYKTTGNPDHNHTSNCFTNGGLVDKVNAIMVNIGD